jgi:3-oxoacyl-[acyl-carrier protein] reductase
VISLAGRRALVTGGSRGIGAATALLLGECGADVVIGYRARRADADSVVDQLRGLGVRAAAHGFDISSRDGAEGLVARATEELGGLDIFVGNAGIWPADASPLAEMSDDRWRRTMALNLDSIFFTARAAARRLEPGGRMVLVASTAGQRGEAFHADYAATKGAVIALTKSLVGELAPRDVTVNCVAPGWVDTEMCAEPYANGGRERIASTIPLGRVACPEDIAGPIVFLCSPFARHITGEILNVNGGSVLCG